MSIIIRYLFISMFLINSSCVFSQEFSEVNNLKSGIVATLDNKYGSDPLLYNGRLYRYYVPVRTIGTPFLENREYTYGTVRLRDIIFNNVLLNYDIFNQQLVMQFISENGGVDQMAISDAWLQAFELKGMNFEIHAIQDTVKQIYQVLGTGPLQIMNQISKELSIDTPVGATNLRFSVPQKTSYLFTNGRLLKFNNNRTFVAQFDGNQKKDIKKYMRKHKINVKKSEDKVVTELLNFCITLK